MTLKWICKYPIRPAGDVPITFELIRDDPRWKICGQSFQHPTFVIEHIAREHVKDGDFMEIMRNIRVEPDN